MRRKDREITDKQDILEVMRKCDVCRIALHDGDYPYIVPLNFGLQVENDMPVLYFHGALEGKNSPTTGLNITPSAVMIMFFIRTQLPICYTKYTGKMFAGRKKIRVNRKRQPGIFRNGLRTSVDFG